jgi:hypothetical protein
VASLTLPRRYAVVFIQQRALCLGYPVHRSLPPTRRSFTDENLVPREAQDKPLSPHATLSLLRAARMASKTLRLPAEVYAKPGPRQELLTRR